MRTIRMLTRAVLLLAIAALALPAFAQEDACWNKFGEWDAETSECRFRNSYELTLNYPLELTLRHPAIETAIDDLIRSERSMFFTFVTEDLGLYNSFGPWVQYIDYELYQFNEDIISIVFTISEYTGGAHPNSYFQTLTFDVRDGSTLALFDLFQEEFNPMPLLSSIVQERLTAQMGDMADVAWIADGTGEDPTNYMNFAIAADELIFFFPPYQVAAYAAGPQEVRIPLADLQVILAPPFFR